jgi:predicted PurR-regulated permease PerM
MDYLPQLSEPLRRWTRFLGLLAGLALLCWVTLRLRVVFTPLLVAAAIAYVLNPAVTWLERVRRVPRLTSVIVAFALLGAVLLGGGFYLAGKTAAQLMQLQGRIPRYVQTIGHWVNLASDRVHTPAPEDAGATASMPTTSPAVANDWWDWVAPLLQEHGVGAARAALNYLSSTLASVVGALSLLVLIPLFTFYFLWRFNDGVRLLRDFLPAAYREQIVHVVTTVDSAIANFFRGRLIICLIVGGLTSLGWTLVGVPYSVPLGVLTGVLNLVPFLALLALPPALLATYLGAMETGDPWFWPLILTMGMYLAVQALDTFVLSPAILGHSSGLHPLVIVVVLLIGAELGGLLGLLLAVPVASTLRTLAAELVLPELRRLAGRSP